MAGGGGTRFWPISTSDVPKQFVTVDGTRRSFLQVTADRFRGVIPPERTLVVTNRKYTGMVREHLPEIPEENILSEPYKRDTAACIALAAFTLMKRDPQATMVVVPSDHFVFDKENFLCAIHSTVEQIDAHPDILMTLGITPTRPDTNYGYIQCDGIPAQATPIRVRTFTEKPDAELARVFVQSGEFLWNSGMFIWKARTILDEFERHMPMIIKQFEGWEEALGTPVEESFLEKVYADIQKISIDYAIMERTDRAWVYPVSMGWYDIGTWESLYSFFPGKDSEGNAGNTPRLLRDASGNLLLSTDTDKLIAVCGLEDYIVVDTSKVLLVCPRDDRKVREFSLNLAKAEFERYR